MSEHVQTMPFNDAIEHLRLPNLKSGLFSSEDWGRILIKTYDTKLFVRYVERDGGIQSYIIYSAVRNFLEYKICILSYSDYCDCSVANLKDWQEIFASLKRDYPDYRIAIRNLRDPLPRQIPELRILSTEKFHTLDLSPDLQQLWKNTHDSFKSAVKQAQKAGVVVRRCEKGDLRKFYELHLTVRKKKYRIFPQPYRFFEVIWEEMIDRGDGVLLGAFSPKGKFIGGNIYLACGGTFYYKFNTSSLTDLNYRPNNLLFWEGMKYAKELKCKTLDMGSSGLEQKGLIQFKNHTGAAEMEITHLGYEPPGYKFSQKRILKFATRFFTLPIMPSSALRFGSSIIYPFLA